MEIDEILETEPSKLTINQLKSVLSEQGVELPTTKEKKEVYVSLFEKLQRDKKRELKDPKRKRKSIIKPIVQASDSEDSPAKKLKPTKEKLTKRKERDELIESKSKSEPRPKKPAIVRKAAATERKVRPNPYQLAHSSDEEEIRTRKISRTPKEKKDSARIAPRVLDFDEPVEKGKERLASPGSFPSPGVPSPGVFSSPFSTKQSPSSANTVLLTPDKVEEYLASSPKLTSSRTHKTTSLSLKFWGFFVCLCWLTIAATMGWVWLGQQPPYFCDDLSDFPCVDCPPHGICKDGLLECERNYVNTGLKCELGEEYVKLLPQATRIAKQILEEHHGLEKCGRGSRRVTWANLYEELKQQIPNFDDSVAPGVYQTLQELPDIEMEEESSYYDCKKSICDESLFEAKGFHLPWDCWLRLKAAENVYVLLLLLLALVATGFTLRRVRKHREEQIATRQLVRQIHRLLQRQKIRSQNSNEEASIAVTHVRDTLLKPPMPKALRDRLWMLAKAAVAADTRIESKAELYHGEQISSWEWSAPIVEGEINGHEGFALSRGPSRDEESSTAVQHRYPGLFGERLFK